jgi:DNA transformation protein
MAVNSEFRDYIPKLCEPFAQVTAKSTFGGCGLYLGGIFFAILAGDTLFLKANDETRDDFIKAGLSVFAYTAQGEPLSLSFYAAPEQTLEESEQLESWVRKAVAAGDREAKKKAAKKTEKEKS